MQVWSVETFKHNYFNPALVGWHGANYYYSLEAATKAAEAEAERFGADKVRVVSREGEEAEAWVDRVDDWASD